MADGSRTGPPHISDKTPDFRVNGVLTELKTLQGTNQNTAVANIQKAFKQGGAQQVIIDARHLDFATGDVLNIIRRAAGSYSNKTLPGTVQFWTQMGKFRF